MIGDNSIEVDLFVPVEREPFGYYRVCCKISKSSDLVVQVALDGVSSDQKLRQSAGVLWSDSNSGSMGWANVNGTIVGPDDTCF